MEKVYCINCKYYYPISCYAYTPIFAHCNAPIGKIKYNYVYGRFKERMGLEVTDEKYPNKQCTCSYYKRKWYKFWVK